MPFMISVGLAIVFVLALASARVIIPAGDTGVVFNTWNGSLSIHPSGSCIVVPFITQVRLYPASLRTYTMVQRPDEGQHTGDDSIDLPSQEGQHIKQDISITYNVSPENAARVFRQFRGQDIQQIEDTFIRRSTITVAQNVSGQMALMDIIGPKRQQLESNIDRKLREQLGAAGFDVNTVNLGASHLPDSVEQALQTKMQAQQKAQQAQYELLRAQIEAQQKVIEARAAAQSEVLKAEGEAKANQVKSQSITPAILKQMWIERWNGDVPRVAGGNSGLLMSYGDLAK